MPETRIPLELRQPGGISEAFGERVAVNLQLGYLEHERRKCGYCGAVTGQSVAREVVFIFGYSKRRFSCVGNTIKMLCFIFYGHSNLL